MNTNKVTKVIKFSASWCMPCRRYAPTFKRVSEMEEYKDITFEAIEIDDGGDYDLEIEKYGIKSVPTTLLLDENGDPIYKLMGVMPEKDLIDIINKALEDR